jgi:catalase
VLFDQHISIMATHPLQAIGEAIGAAGADPRVVQRSSLFQGANDGPAKTAAKITGVQGIAKRADDGPYFTNNEGIPFPDPSHSKTAGGLPLVSDAFLLQKQQHFNRSKNLERMVHPCKCRSPLLPESQVDLYQAVAEHLGFLRPPRICPPLQK